MKSIDITEIDRDFKIQLPPFSVKSQTTAQAEKVIKTYGSVVPEVPANLDHVISKARDYFHSSSSHALSAKETRVIAFVSLSLDEDDDFFLAFFKHIRKEKSRRVLSALFASFVMNFDENSQRVIKAAEVIKKDKELLSKSWKKRLEYCDLLSVKKVQTFLAKKILESGDERHVFENAGIVGAFSGSLLVQGTYIALARLVGERVESGDTEVLYDFLKIICVGDRIKPQAGAAAMIAALKPFLANPPSAHLKGLLQGIFINSFSDPRVSTSQWPALSHREGGDKLRNDCLGIVKRWLNFEAIELFFKVIAEHAPDAQFEPRRQLWKSYFDQEVVGEAHIALGQSADKTARRLKQTDENARGLIWGELNGANPDQSVLLMQIGELTVAEWSHNGKFRAWSSESIDKPKFYRSKYSASELKRGSNKIRNANGNYSDGIVHLGNWVERAKRYVGQETGIRLARRIR